MLHYTTAGQGRPLVLIHGFPNDSSSWQPIVGHLSKYFRLIMPDLPGAGQSEAAQAPLSMALMAEAIKEVLDYEKIGQCVLAGHSMGGYVAIEFAALYPQRVAGLSFVHSLAGADSEEKKETRRKSNVLMLKGEAEKRAFLKGMAQNLFAASFAAAHSNVVEAIAEKGAALPATHLAAFYDAIMARKDNREILETATFPVQWIIGDEDKATPMNEALQQAHLAAINDVHIYENCGHMSFLEHPQRLAEDTEQFGHYCYQLTRFR
ncbi:MAG: alpha/beta hydrolase [Edaphocola sp.]